MPRALPTVVLDAAAILGIGAFAIFGLVVPFGALSASFFGHAGQLWDPEVLAAARITALQAAVSALISTALGVLIAFALPRDSRAVRALLGLPFGIPAVAAASAWVLCLPRAFSYSLGAVIIAHVFFNVPWVALWVSRALDDVSREQLEAARTLGASRMSAFRWVTAPVIGPAAAGAFTQVFSLCAMSFILIMILGGGPPVDTLETTLFSKIRAGGLDLSGAGACAIWQIAITLPPWLLFRSTRKPRALGSKRAARSKRRSSRAFRWFGIAVATFFLLPYLALFFLVLRSVLNPTLRGSLGDRSLIGDVLPALGLSIRIGLVTAIFSTSLAAMGVWAEERNRFFARMGSLALVLPAGISVMVLGLGFFVAYGKYLDPFSASLWPIILLETILFVPVAFRVLQPIARARNRGAWDAALTLGASPWAAFGFVEWPRWRGPVLGVLSLVAGAALGEVAAVSLFFNEARIPASLLISRWMGQYHFEEAQVLSVVLMVAAAAFIGFGMWADFAGPAGSTTGEVCQR